MRHRVFIRRSVFLALTAVGLAASWWGCAAASDQGPTGSGTTQSSSSSTSGGEGGFMIPEGGPEAGEGGTDDAGPCVSTSAAAHHVQLDMIIVMDQSQFLAGADWTAITNALKAFFVDPASSGIGVGLLFYPYSPYDCDLNHYKVLTVPLDVLPKNAFALTNAIPASAEGLGTPIEPALVGSLMQATALQDANPTHRVVVVLATSGNLMGLVTPGQSDANMCGDDGAEPEFVELADDAANALGYDGVRTFVIGVPGATLPDLDTLAAGGGTTAAFDATNPLQFAAKIAAIRQAGLGCDYPIPQPPNNMQLDLDKVNFQYTPMGIGLPTILPRAANLLDCGGAPGWYLDSTSSPAKIVLCPVSCSAVEADNTAEVNVLFGCTSVTR